MNDIKKVLIAIDNEPTSEKVALYGFQLGFRLNCEIALISVVDTTMLVTESTLTPMEFVQIIKNDCKKNQQLLIDNVFKDYKVWSFIKKGKPYEVILDVAKEWDADVIVIGTHGRTGILRLLLGSVAENVLRHSEKPVFIIPTKS
ncbi:universal stress protein [Flavobacterium sp. W1B]|uniref:universal stress protein n=1 Tax=Flavobacterium sp. W1B TaxID=3394146 RepID=UPI0039BC55AF